MEEGDVRNETAFVTEMNWHFAEVGEKTLCPFRGGMNTWRAIKGMGAVV